MTRKLQLFGTILFELLIYLRALKVHQLYYCPYTLNISILTYAMKGAFSKLGAFPY